MMMKKMRKKLGLFCGLLFVMLLLIPTPAQAKSKGVALTAKNFPDTGILNKVKEYDKDKNGYLSKKELAAVTEFYYDGSFDDFSQLRFFTGIKSLTLDAWGYGLWIGNEVDLTMFPKLEKVLINFDSMRWRPNGSHEIRITVAGLQHLKELDIDEYDDAYGETYETRNIDVVDFRNTPALKRVTLGNAKGVIFDDGAKFEELSLFAVSDIPEDQIGDFTGLKKLSIVTDDPDFTQIDLSKLKKLTSLRLSKAPLETVTTAGARALEELRIGSAALKKLDLSQNTKLTTIALACPLLEELNLENSPALDFLRVSSEHLTKLDVKNHAALRSLYIESDELETIDISKNTMLQSAWFYTEQLKTLDITKNKKLNTLYICSQRLANLNLSKNKKLKTLHICLQTLADLNLSENKKLSTLFVSECPLESLDVSANTRLRDITVEKTCLTSLKLPPLELLRTLSVTENRNLTSLKLSENPQIEYLTVKGNALTSLNLQQQTTLKELTVEEDLLTSLNLLQQSVLEKVTVSGQKLAELQIAAKARIDKITVKHTAIKALVFPKLRRLFSLEVVDNPQLKRLDVSKAPKLQWILLTGNKQLKNLDLSANEKLYEVNVSDNALETLTFGKLPILYHLYCQKNNLTQIDLSQTERESLEVYCDAGVKVKGCSGTVYTGEPPHTDN